MGGGIIQLAAKGVDDAYLTGNPDITPFKIIYRRHTNFAMYPNNLYFLGGLDFGKTARCKIRPCGDFVTEVYFVAELPQIFMEFKKLTQASVASVLKVYGIVWKYSGKPEDITTIKIYNTEIVPLVNNYVTTLKKEYDKLLNQLEYFTNIGPSPPDLYNLTIMNLYQYINSIIGDIASNNAYDTLRFFLRAYGLDLPNQLGIVANYDDVHDIWLTELFRTILSSDDQNFHNLQLPCNTFTFPEIVTDIQVLAAIQLGNYNVSNYYNNIEIKYYFDKVLENAFTTNFFYIVKTKFVPFSDTYIILQQYINSLNATNNSNLIDISTQNNINFTLVNVVNSIQVNIYKDMIQLFNIISLFRNNNYDKRLQFRIGFVKDFVYNINNAGVVNYDGSEAMTIVPDASTNPYFNDFFTTVLPVPPGTEPTVEHFYGNYVKTQTNNFINNIRLPLQNDVFQDYLADEILWNELVMSKYFGNTEETWGNFNDVYVMNIIPLYVAFQIPLLVNYALTEHGVPYFEANAKFFDLTKTTFALDLFNAIKPSFENYIMPNNKFDIKSYLKELKNTHNLIGSNNKILTAFFKSELLLNIDLSPYSQKTIDDVNEINTHLTPLEYVIKNYLYKYTEIINTFEPAPFVPLPNNFGTLPSNFREQFKAVILNSCVEIFRYTEKLGPLPSYNKYVSNGYSLYQINSSIFINLYGTDLPATRIPAFSDAISSIWYNVQKKMIESFDQNFQTILSNKIIPTKNNIGEVIPPNNFTKMLIEFQQILEEVQNYSPIDKINYYRIRPKEIGNQSYESLLGSPNCTDRFACDYIGLYGGRVLNYSTYLGEFERYFDLFLLKNPTINRVKNYYKRFNQLNLLFANEITNNYDIYVPKSKRTDTFPTDIEYAIESTKAVVGAYNGERDTTIPCTAVNDIIRRFYHGTPIDIKYELRDILIFAINGAKNLINPFDPFDNAALFQWWNVNLNNINDNLLAQYDDIINPVFVDDDSTIMYEDPNINTFCTNVQNDAQNLGTLYQFGLSAVPLRTVIDVIEYMITLVLRKKGLGNFLDLVFRSASTSLLSGALSTPLMTYQNIITYLEKNIQSLEKTLNEIAFINNKLNAKNKYEGFVGSLLDKQLRKSINLTRPMFKWVKQIGHYLIEDIKLEIGGQIIDQHNSRWLQINHEITKNVNKERVYNILIGNVQELYNFSGVQNSTTGLIKDKYIISVPLQFSFCKAITNALPIIAMHYSDIYIVVKTRNLNELALWDQDAVFIKKPILKCNLNATYIYVEKEERKIVVENRRQILTELVQICSEFIIGKQAFPQNILPIRLYFTYSSKLLVWQFRFNKKNPDPEELWDWTNTKFYNRHGKLIDPIETITIYLNGQTREQAKISKFYNCLQPYNRGISSLDDNTFVYSFALEPLKLQPTGTADLGQIDELIFNFTLNSDVIDQINNNNMELKIVFYNFGYNILRVLSGMAALAFYASELNH